MDPRIAKLRCVSVECPGTVNLAQFALHVGEADAHACSRLIGENLDCALVDLASRDEA